MLCETRFGVVFLTFDYQVGGNSMGEFCSFHGRWAACHVKSLCNLQDAINSASSLTQTLSGELADGQRQLLAMVAAGANSKAVNPSAKLGNGPLPGLHEMVCFCFIAKLCVY